MLHLAWFAFAKALSNSRSPRRLRPRHLRRERKIACKILGCPAAISGRRPAKGRQPGANSEIIRNRQSLLSVRLQQVLLDFHRNSPQQLTDVDEQACSPDAFHDDATFIFKQS